MRIPVVALLSTSFLAIFAAGCPSPDYGGVPLHALDLTERGSPAKPSASTPVAPKRPEVWSARSGRPWRYIVIHHSATQGGNAALFDRLHRGPRFGFDELGYHFLIDNGDGGPDGAVEVGPRWVKQKWGAHTGGTPDNEYNNYGIGICLVGDFSRHMPTPAQMASLRRLVVQLMFTYGIGPQSVLGHRDAPNATTECPGDALYAYVHGGFRSEVSQLVATAGAGPRK